MTLDQDQMVHGEILNLKQEMRFVVAVHYSSTGKRHSPRRPQFCKYCRRTHHKGCWKKKAEKKEARQKSLEGVKTHLTTAALRSQGQCPKRPLRKASDVRRNAYRSYVVGRAKKGTICQV